MTHVRIIAKSNLVHESMVDYRRFQHDPKCLMEIGGDMLSGTVIVKNLKNLGEGDEKYWEKKQIIGNPFFFFKIVLDRSYCEKFIGTVDKSTISQ